MEAHPNDAEVKFVTYDGEKWVSAWNLTLGQARDDMLIRAVELANGERLRLRGNPQ